MTITSTLFLFLFLPLTLLGYYLMRKELKNAFLLLASIIFYFLSDPNSIWIIVVSIAVNYLLGLGIGNNVKNAAEQSDDKIKSGYMIIAKVLLVLGLIFNFGMLFYYKYTGFAVKTINSLFRLDFELPIIGLPIGISFFTFRAVSYLLDIYIYIYPNTSLAQKNPINAALYISFFPQVTMGPITKYSDFERQFGSRKFDADMFADGLKQIVLGLFKKVVFANGLGTMVDYIFDMPHSERTVVMAWLGIIGYLVQLYYDFAGYSDMAIGLGKLFGFNTPKNFDYPYASKSVAEFWNRWHITLGAWLKDYIYTPVFRSLQGKKKISIYWCDIIALFAVWLFSGAWHGSAWSFIAWGLYQFAFIAFERTIEYKQKQRRKKLGLKKQPETKLHKILSHIYFILVLIVGQIMFRIEGFWNFFPYVGEMFGIGGLRKFSPHGVLCGKFSSPLTELFFQDNAFLLTAGIIFSFPVLPWIKKHIIDKHTVINKLTAFFEPLLYVGAFLIVISYSMSSSYDPFLYNQF